MNRSTHRFALQAYYKEPDWQNSFWGSNYERLSQIKTKVDPNGLFWVTPGINAEKFQTVNGRVCRVESPRAVGRTDIAPATDNQNLGDYATGGENQFGRMDLIAEFPRPGTLLGIQGN